MRIGDIFKEYTESYDRIISPEALQPYNELLTAHVEALKQKKKILESGSGPGQLSMRLLREDCTLHAVDQYNQRYIKNIKDHWFSKEEVSTMLTEAGLEVISATGNPLYYGKGYIVTATKK